MLDVFNSDGFGIVPLTQSIEKIPFRPGRVGEMGLFTETGVASTTIALEERDGLIVVVNPSPRGGAGQTFTKNKRTMRAVAIPHFQLDDGVMAEEVQGVRAWGSETATEMLADRVAERGMIARQSLAITQEMNRLGAIKGVITYGDSSTLSMFTTFGVSQIGEIDFDLDNASPAAGAVRKKCAEVVKNIMDELGGLPFTGVRALCGATFFEQLISHSEVRATYLNQQAASELRTGYIRGPGGLSQMIYSAFEFGGIVFEHYRGTFNGSVAVADTKAHFFPEGVPGLFRTFYAPADYNETVNTIGRPIYAKMWPTDNDKGYSLEFQMNALEMCMRPRTLILAKNT